MSNTEKELKALLQKCQNEGGLNFDDRQRYSNLCGEAGISMDEAMRMYDRLSNAKLHAAQLANKAESKIASRTATDADIVAAVKAVNTERSTASPTGPAAVQSVKPTKATTPGMDKATADYLEALNAERSAGINHTSGRR